MHPARQKILSDRLEHNRGETHMEFAIRDWAKTVIAWLGDGRRGPFVFPVHCTARYWEPDEIPSYRPFAEVRVNPISSLRGESGLLVVEKMLRTALEDVAP